MNRIILARLRWSSRERDVFGIGALSSLDDVFRVMPSCLMWYDAPSDDIEWKTSSNSATWGIVPAKAAWKAA